MARQKVPKTTWEQFPAISNIAPNMTTMIFVGGGCIVFISKFAERKVNPSTQLN